MNRIEMKKEISRKIGKAQRAAKYGDIKSAFKNIQSVIRALNNGCDAKLKNDVLVRIQEIFDLMENALRSKAEDAVDNPNLYRYYSGEIERFLRKKKKIPHI